MTASNTPGSAERATPSVEDVIGILKRILFTDLDVSIALGQIDSNTPLLEEGLALDSVVLVQMIGMVEDELGFEFLDTDLRPRSFRTLRTLAEVIVARLRPLGHSRIG